MVPLPPYWCELNPTELVFQALVARLSGERKRYKALNNNEFYYNIDDEMSRFKQSDVKSFFLKCGYK